MQITNIKNGELDYIIVDDMYSNSELKDIKKELCALLPFTVSPEHVYTAVNEDGTYKKNCKSIRLDSYYKQNRFLSSMLTYNRKIFSKEFNDNLVNFSCFYKHIKCANRDTTLVNYYKSNEKYESHSDDVPFTALTFFELGEVSGGGVIFTEHNIKVDFKNNRTLIFPGCVLHATEPIITNEEGYRVSMAQFIGYIME
jgi:hypothetical protein